MEKRVTRRGALALLERAAFAATAMAPQRSYQYLHADALKVFNEMNTRCAFFVFSFLPFSILFLLAGNLGKAGS